MRGTTLRKLLSAIVSSALCAGIMVVIVEEGPVELPYYDGTQANPVTSPQVDMLFSGESQNETAETTADYSVPEANGNGQYQNAAYGNGSEAPKVTRRIRTGYRSRAQ